MVGRISAVVLVMLLSFTGCATNSLLSPNANSAFEAGMDQFGQDRFESAIEYFNHALEIDPEHAPSYQYLGRSLFYLGRWLEAVSYLREAYLRIPADEQNEVAGELAEMMMAYGSQLNSEGRFDDAVDVYSESLELAPDELQGHLGLARALFGKSDCSQAIITVERALEKSPGNPELIDMMKQIMEGN